MNFARIAIIVDNALLMANYTHLLVRLDASMKPSRKQNIVTHFKQTSSIDQELFQSRAVHSFI